MVFADKLTIDTPEQISLDYEVAGPGSRFLALFLDMLIQAAGFFVVGVLFAVVGISFKRISSPAISGNWAVAIVIFLLFFLQWAYFVVFEILWKGQTPGKRQVGIRVINESGREAQAFEAITRNLLRAVDMLPTGYALGAIVMFISPQRKRIGDYVAGTIVVHDRKPEQDEIFYNTKAADVSESVSYQKLTAGDIQVMEAFLHRRLDLAQDVRQSTARRLADHFGKKCGVAFPDRRDDENFLEHLVRGFRRVARYSGPNHT